MHKMTYDYHPSLTAISMPMDVPIEPIHTEPKKQQEPKQLQEKTKER